MTEKLNKSFSRRIGKSLSTTQKDAITNLLPQYLLEPKTLNAKQYIAEIGIGMGEHFITQASRNPDITYIGFEPYLNGIANALLLAQKNNVTNIRLWPDDVDLVFKHIPDHCLNAIYILFPDPWPKTKQKKRRIICEERIGLFASKLAADGALYFASDIEDYVESVKILLAKSRLFMPVDNQNNMPHEGYIQTKYHGKAIKEGRTAKFLQYKILS